MAFDSNCTDDEEEENHHLSNRLQKIMDKAILMSDLINSQTVKSTATVFGRYEIGCGLILKSVSCDCCYMEPNYKYQCAFCQCEKWFG